MGRLWFVKKSFIIYPHTYCFRADGRRKSVGNWLTHCYLENGMVVCLCVSVCVQMMTLLLDLTYCGRFQLAIDVDMVFGRSAYLSVMLTKLQGIARLQFTRLPFTHWSFTFTQVMSCKLNLH